MRTLVAHDSGLAGLGVVRPLRDGARRVQLAILLAQRAAGGLHRFEIHAHEVGLVFIAQLALGEQTLGPVFQSQDRPRSERAAIAGLIERIAVLIRHAAECQEVRLKGRLNVAGPPLARAGNGHRVDRFGASRPGAQRRVFDRRLRDDIDSLSRPEGHRASIVSRCVGSAFLLDFGEFHLRPESVTRILRPCEEVILRGFRGFPAGCIPHAKQRQQYAQFCIHSHYSVSFSRNLDCFSSEDCPVLSFSQDVQIHHSIESHRMVPQKNAHEHKAHVRYLYRCGNSPRQPAILGTPWWRLFERFAKLGCVFAFYGPVGACARRASRSMLFA